MKRKVDRSVDTAWLMVISALRVEVVPGAVAARSLRMLTPRRWMLGGLLMTAPMLGFYSYTRPVEDIVYISMLGDIFWIFGTTL